MEALISVHGLSKTFEMRRRGAPRTVRAVDDITFDVEPGEMLAFIGPNGAGKSTTIKCITGILRPSGGSISVLGMDPFRSRRSLAGRIGAVFGQRSQLWYHLPAVDSLRLLGDIYGVERHEARRRIARLVDLFEIGPYLDTPVRKLSLGERVRCEIAASLIHEPGILFLDEPTIGLDVIARQIVRDLVKRVNAEKGTTVFLTSHDAGDIEKICRRVIVINHGRICWDDTVNTMKYAFLRRRIIDLKLDAPLTLAMDGVEVVKAKGYAAKLEVDLERTSLEEVVSRIMRDNRVEDITIENPPMERIITMIYRGESTGGDGP